MKPVRDAETTRTRIADTAEQLFRSIGYQKTAVADIARELGMSPANVYRFFPSKIAICEAICARQLSDIAEGVWGIARSEARAEDRLRRMAHYLFERNMGAFFTARRMHDMVTAAIGEHWAVVDRYVETLHGATRHVLMDGIAAGDFAPVADADRLALAYDDALILWKHPMVISECLGHGDEPDAITRQLDATLDLLLRGLRA